MQTKAIEVSTTKTTKLCLLSAILLHSMDLGRYGPYISQRH